MTDYSIEGCIVSRETGHFNDTLASAYKTNERPLCLCMTPGIPMYIARIHDDTFVIKRMPNSGQTHHPDCESYEIPPELSGRGEVDHKAISEDHSTGLTSLKLDFSLSKVAVNRAAPQGKSKDTSVVKADPTKLTIRSLLHYLYEEAGLNKWSPNMVGKRNWYIVRKYLMLAAHNKITRKLPLADSLLMPEQFSLEHKDEIVARRRKTLAKLNKQGSKTPMGILIGEVKDIGATRYGHKLVIKHMPDTPVYMDEKVYKRMNKAFPTELAFFFENELIHLLTICTFYLTPTGSPQIDTISFMVVDNNWLPFESIEELELLERLTSESRHFIKGLRYNLTACDVIASVLLTDTKDTPTAVYLVPAGADEHYYEELNSVVEGSELESKIIDINNEDSLHMK